MTIRTSIAWIAVAVAVFAAMAMWPRAVPYAIPLLLAALGGVVTERAGIVDLALEGKLLFGAFAAAVISLLTDSTPLGVVAGMLAGIAVATLQLVLALRFGAHQVIIGIGINLLALGGTRFLLQLCYGEGANSPHRDGYGDAALANPVFWVAAVAALVVPIAMARTRWGLRLRAAGDRPEALVAVGVSPASARIAAGVVGGALAGAGGAQLVLRQDHFQPDMSSGLGYMAIAMVILAGWRPAWVVIACVGMAFASSFTTDLQVAGIPIPNELSMLPPYVLTLVVLVVAKHRPPPRSLGRI